jgi:predicted DNA-binding transcriptional regulator AlpA
MMSVPGDTVAVVVPRKRIPTAQPRARKPGSLLGVGEIAELLGVSRQRASILTRRADFPAPEVELRMGMVWRAAPVERWLAEYRRANPS